MIMESEDDRVLNIRKQNTAFINAVAKQFSDLNYVKEISKNDAMFDGKIQPYYNTGLTALHAIKLALSAKQTYEINNILDFGCGHGRVMRMLRAAWPEANIFAYDIFDDAINFCVDHFNALPLKAPQNITDTKLENNKFDLVWLGSIFTHLDANDFVNLLEEIKSSLSDKGAAIFSIAGPFVVRLIREGFRGGVSDNTAISMLASYDSNGFGFGFYKGQEDRRWGWTIAKPTWVARAVEEAGLQMLLNMERGWGGRQDIVAVHRWDIK